MVANRTVLEELDFGRQVAEEEEQELADYFVQTEHWRLLRSGAVDVIYGPKGAGKSALYATAISEKVGLKASRIIAIAGENVRGTPVFADLAADPPGGDYRVLWKLYVICLVVAECRRELSTSRDGESIVAELTAARLVPDEGGLRGILRVVARYVRNLAGGASLENTVTVNPVTAAPEWKAALRLQPTDDTPLMISAPDDLLQRLDAVLKELGDTAWVLLDRLDVAFEDAGIEDLALPALFRTYLDMAPLTNLRIKVFLRADIWQRIASSGFREASHITRETTIQWDVATLINLVVRRIVRNPTVCEYLAVEQAAVLGSDALQRDVLRRLLPDTMVLSSGRSIPAIEWLFEVTKDGFGGNAPRELLHLLREARQREIGRRERGAAPPDQGALLSRDALRDALLTVSRVRLDKAICAEFPLLLEYIQALKGETAELTVEALQEIWSLGNGDTLRVAKQLTSIGFFCASGTKRNPTFRVPPLHGAALELTDCEF